MNSDAKKYVASCDLFQRVKHLNYSIEGEYSMVPASEPSELVTVDFYGPLPHSIGGVEYIFVLLDVHLKYVKLYPIKKANTRIILKKVLEHYIPAVGKPFRIIIGQWYTVYITGMEIALAARKY